MAETDNLKLALPGSNEYVDVEVLNENFRKIDTSVLLALAAAAPYSAAATYAVGAYCTKGGKLYRCTVVIPQAEAWNAAHWAETTMGAELVAIYTTLANKAPGGYGLGIAVNLFNGDVNEYHGNGFYAWGSVKPKNAPTLLRDEGTYMYMFEFGDSSGFTQIMGCYIQTSPGLICRQAFAKSGGVQFAEWEWINPPMALNTEYRTTERHLGKPVYVKAVDCGEITNGKQIATGINWALKVDIVSIQGSYSNPLPLVPFNTSAESLNKYGAAFYVNLHSIIFVCGPEGAGGQAIAIIRYTKTTD